MDFEIHNALFDIEIDGVPVWERLRFTTFRLIRERISSKPERRIQNSSFRTYLTAATLWLRNSCLRNPFCVSNHDVIFIGHSRRKQEGDHWWDIYSDPVHAACSFDAVHFERAYHLSHRTPPKTDNLRYLDFIEIGGTIQRKLGFHSLSLTEEQKNRLRFVEDAVRRQFGVKISVMERAIAELRSRRSRLWLYRYLLRKVDPRVAVIVVSYGKETFIEACQLEGVPVAELQHGVIHQGHLGYSYPGNRSKEMFPDYVLTWGEVWGEEVQLPIAGDRVIPVGFPYLEEAKEEYDDVVSGNQVLFISQSTIGKELSKFAVEVSKYVGIEYDVVYKLHPSEYQGWKEEYPWLVDAEVEVVDGSGKRLYRLFAESKVQVGVYSTALFEGLYFNLVTALFDHPDRVVLKRFLEEGVANVVGTAEELAEVVEEKKVEFRRGRVFADGASERVCRIISRLGENRG